MGIEFYKDVDSEDRWRIVGSDEDDIIHACHEGFSGKHNALTNLFINHAMMSIWIRHVAKGDGYKLKFDKGTVNFENDRDGKIRWQIKASNGEIVGASHKGFNDKHLAADNLIITYTMLAMYIAQFALDRVSG